MNDFNIKVIANRKLAEDKIFLAESSWESKASIILNKWLPSIQEVNPSGYTDIRELKYSDLMSVLSKYSHFKKNTLNNFINSINSVIKYAIKNGILNDKSLVIDKIRVQKSIPDPFDYKDAKRICDAVMQHDRVFGLYCYIGFFTGCRTSEILGLKWKDVDPVNNEIYIRRTIVRNKLRECTKSYTVRCVQLNDYALYALRELDKITYEYGSFVFYDSVHRRNYTNFNMRIFYKIWYEVLNNLNIRRRSPYNMRHTYATMYLMNGCNIAWLAKQMGHSTPKTTLDYYATWIPNSDRKDISIINKDSYEKLHMDHINLISKLKTGKFN